MPTLLLAAVLALDIPPLPSADTTQARLATNYPDCGHDFPPEVHKVAYEWLDCWLNGK